RGPPCTATSFSSGGWPFERARTLPGTTLPEDASSLGVPLRVSLRTSRDQVGETRDLGQVAGRGQTGQAERVEGVAGQQLQVVVVGLEPAARFVVEEVALVHGIARAERRIERRVDLVELRHSSENACFAASRVRSTCSSVCASDGNQASNWDGGG